MPKLLFAGDLCVSTAAQPIVGQRLLELLHAADFVCINYEAPLGAVSAVPAGKAGPAIRQIKQSIDLVRTCMASHLNLANNHIMDFGRAGLQNTLEAFPDLPCLGAALRGRDAYRATWIEHNGQSIALLAFAEAQFGVVNEPATAQAGFAWIDHPLARRTILEARQVADFVFVQVHAGLEMVDLPLPEWRDRYRELIDLGADLVIGHHPHVLQGSEKYRGKMIHYSLGNFYMDIMLRQAAPGSGGVLLVDIDSSGESAGNPPSITSRMIPLRVTRDAIDLDESEKAAAHYANLCHRLTDETTYRAEIQEICHRFWRETYAKYYESALTGFGTKPNLSAAKCIIRRFGGSLLKRRNRTLANELLLLHNIRIESHRWTVERALAHGKL